MRMFYNSDQFTVVRIDLADEATADLSGELTAAGGFEIMDKTAQVGIYLAGDVAREFHRQLRALATQQDDDALDDFIAGYAHLASPHLALH